MNLLRGLIVLAFMSTAAQPAVRCAPAKFVKMVLESQFGELQIMTGTFNSGRAMRGYVNPITRTFTVLMILPSGQVCIIAAGKNLDMFPPVAIKPKTESP